MLFAGAELMPAAPMSPGDRNLVAMPLFHVGGTCYALLGIYAGVPSTFTREPDPASLLAAFTAGATHAFVVPAVVSALLADPATGQDTAAGAPGTGKDATGRSDAEVTRASPFTLRASACASRLAVR